MCTICSVHWTVFYFFTLRWIATYVIDCSNFMGRLLFRDMQCRTNQKENLKMEMIFTYYSINERFRGTMACIFISYFFFLYRGMCSLLFITYENHIRHERHTSFHHRSTGGAVFLRYCPARWIWQKLDSLDRSSLKRETLKVLRKIRPSPILWEPLKVLERLLVF